MPHQDLSPAWKFKPSHPKELVLGDVSEGIRTRTKAYYSTAESAFFSQLEPKNIGEALKDEGWIQAMQDELNQFKRSDVW